MEKPPLMPLGLLFLSFPHRGPVRICGSPAQLATNLRCMEPEVSSGCNTEESPQGHAVELPAMKVRFVRWTEELIRHFGKPETLSQSEPLCGLVTEKQKMLSSSFFPQRWQPSLGTLWPIFPSCFYTKHGCGEHDLGLWSSGQKEELWFRVEDGKPCRSLPHRFPHLLLLLPEKPGRKFYMR